jgi:hypothetical protein
VAIRTFAVCNLKQPPPVSFKTEAYTLVSPCKKKKKAYVQGVSWEHDEFFKFNFENRQIPATHLV